MNTKQFNYSYGAKRGRNIYIDATYPLEGNEIEGYIVYNIAVHIYTDTKSGNVEKVETRYIMKNNTGLKEYSPLDVYKETGYTIEQIHNESIDYARLQGY